MKNFITLLLVLFIVSGTKFSASAENSAPVSSGPAVSSGWHDVLRRMGINESSGGAEYTALIQKLENFKGLAEKIQRSAGRKVELGEWLRILKGMGIHIKPEMSEEEWKAVLAFAGVQNLDVPVQAAPVRSFEDSYSSSAVNIQAEPAGTPPTTVTLDLRGMDVVEVLKMLSRQSGLNIAASPNVRGNVTIMLKDVNLWDALRMILETNDLAYVYDKGMVRVLTAGDYEKLYGSRFDDKTVVDVLELKHIRAAAAGRFMEQAKSRVGKVIAYEMSNSLILMDTPEAISKMRRMVETLDQPQETKIFEINYAKGEEIALRLKEIGSKDVGEIEFDKRAGRIFVKDSPDKIRRMEALVKAFDSQHRAVLIEAKIMQITLNDRFQMGVNWEHLFNANIQDVLAPGNVKANFNVLPAGALGVTANLGTLAQNNFTAFIQMLETSGKTNLLSSPRIAALNNESAKILVGTKEAYVTTTITTPGGGGPVQSSEQVNFVDVGVKLFVTPAIGADGYITLKIRPEVSSVERTISTAQGNSIPIVRTSESEASVVAKDGETILIGGLIEDRKERNDSRVPFLGRIPLLGIPFRGRSSNQSKTEIVIFLTPKIISGDQIKEATAGPNPDSEPEKG